MKRLRKSLCSCYGSDFRVKYFICSEYGPKTLRPHYHGVIFGLSKKDIPLVNKCWSLGFTKIEVIRCAGSYRYVSKYCSKPAVLRYELSAPVERTFRLVSHGLGKCYCDNPEVQKFHTSDIFGHHYYFSNGFKYGLPRYFTNKLYTNLQNLEYKRLKELKTVKDWRFRFGSKVRLDGRMIVVSSSFQLSQAREADIIAYNQSDGTDMFLFKKFMSKSIF